MDFPLQHTDDRLLGGRVLLRQSRAGFRSGSDAVLLAAASHPPRGGTVLELGTGTGAASLALASRRPDCRVSAVEIQSDSVDLARFNIARNCMSGMVEVAEADIRALPWPHRAFDLVLANPPYFEAGRSRVSPVRARALARGDGETPLSDWIQASLGAVKVGGQIVFINRRERLAEMVEQFAAHGEISVRTLPPASVKPAKRLLLRVKLGGEGFRELPPLRLHAAGGGPSTLAEALLRQGAPIFW